MNIVLIHPYIVVRTLDIYLSEPLGLLCLATYIRQVFSEEDVNVSILDLYALGASSPTAKGDMYIKGVSCEADIYRLLEALKPDLIGVTCCFTGYFEEALDIARIAKKYYPSTPVVMGGAHATLEATNIMINNSFVDYIVCNEGELTFEELIKSLITKNNIDFASIHGLCWRDISGVILNESRKLIENLDILPIPDRRFIDMEHYKKSNSVLFNFHKTAPLATLMTSRGCPYECVFCCTKNMWKRKWRPISLVKVFQEIELLSNEYGIKEICILDDQFIMKKDRIYSFCDYFIRSKKKFVFSNIAGISAWLADDDNLLLKMRKAGFYKLTIPVESANKETLDFIKKPINLQKISMLIKKANKLGYWTGAFFIVGFPYENRKQIMETIDFAYNSEIDFAHFFVAQPYIGTEMYSVYEKEGLLKEPFNSGTYIFRGWHDTLSMKADELNDIVENASSKWLLHKLFYFFRPNNWLNNLLPKISSIDRFSYSVRIFLMLLRRGIVARRKK